MDSLSREAELTRELESARNSLVVVGLFQLTFTIVTLYFIRPPHGLAGVADPRLLELRSEHVLWSMILFGVLALLAGFSKRGPVTALVLGLVAYWGFQLVLEHGWLWKLLFTAALLKGLHAASRGQQLGRELGRRFT